MANVSSILTNLQTSFTSHPQVTQVTDFLGQNKKPLLYSLLGLYLTKKAHNFIDDQGLFARLRFGRLDSETLSRQNGGDIAAKVLQANGVKRIYREFEARILYNPIFFCLTKKRLQTLVFMPSPAAT